MDKKCVYCDKEIRDGVFCDNCWTIVSPLERGRNEERAEATLYFPDYDFLTSDSDKKSYEMKRINPFGKRKW